ncbi:MAG: hypothetical protein ACI870_000265 [Crocinitomicaceae bacterium]|jgi:hypothetical protein
MKKTLILFTFLFGFFLFGNIASALTVSPAKLEISGDPGTTLVGTIKLFNESDRTQTFYTSLENFEPSDDSGTPKFVGAENGLATWMTATASVTLGPKEQTEVSFTVSIPSDIDAGGYFAAVFFGTQPPSPDGGVVAIGGRIGVLTLLRVNGDIPEDGGILGFDTKDSQFWYTIPPVVFEYRFSNDGGDRVVPRGDIEIKNTFGTVRDTIDANSIEGSVLPSSARRFYPTWSVTEIAPLGFIGMVTAQWKNFHFGYYTAEMNLGWGFTNRSEESKVPFFIFPWQILLLLILGASLLFMMIKFGGKSYKKSLMRQLEKIQEEKNKEEE